MPRARKEPPPEPEPALSPAPVQAAGSAGGLLVQLLLPLALGAALLTSVVILGRHLSDLLRRSGGHTIAFTDVECDAPPGLSRAEFLDEAQYLAGLPDRLNALDPDTRQRMFDALALHPWVARVRRLDLLSSGSARADLEFRRPALAVSPDRVVDGEGVVLPRRASPVGLPRLANKVASPAGRAGQLWDDPAVLAAARVAAFAREELARRAVPCEMEVAAGAVTLRLGPERILWGKPPGQEGPGEASAAVKLRRLASAPLPHDLRAPP